MSKPSQWPPVPEELLKRDQRDHRQEYMLEWKPLELCSLCGLPVGNGRSREPTCRTTGDRACWERVRAARRTPARREPVIMRYDGKRGEAGR